MKTNFPPVRARRTNSFFVSPKQPLTYGEKILGSKDTNVALTRMEITQKEACKVLTTLCVEGFAQLGSNDTLPEVQDILTGILLLGNICKRTANEKSNLNDKIEVLNKKHDDMEASKNSMIEHLEEVILKLQNENVKLQDTLAETKFRFTQKLQITQKELSQMKEKVDLAKEENTNLHTKITLQERKIMEIPRMEEKFLRSARGIVRQQEVANSAKEITWKKMEVDVKALNAWKDRAQNLEDLVNKLKVEVENWETQARVNLSKYQTIYSAYNRIKNATMAGNKHIAAYSVAKAIVEVQQKVGMESKQQEEVYQKNLKNGLRPKSAPPKSYIQNRKSSIESGQSSCNNSSSPDKKGAKLHKTLEEVNVEEIARLKTELSIRDAKIQKLNQQLSYARACPLISTTLAPEDEYEDENFVTTPTKTKQKERSPNRFRTNRSAASIESQILGPFTSIKNNQLEALAEESINTSLYPDEDDISANSLYAAEEQAFQQKKLNQAMELQQQFAERMRRVRSGTDIKAKEGDSFAKIRESKSFAKI